MTSPNPGSYNNAATSVGTSVTLIANVASNDAGVLVYNAGSVTVYLGGGTVAASGANQGYPLAATSGVTVPSTGGSENQLYAITGSSTATVVVLFPSSS